jgi:hypothetical protein
VNDVVLRYLNRDERPAFVLDEVHDVTFSNVDAQKGAGAPQFILKNVTNFSAYQVKGVTDTKVDKAEKNEL